ncbi:prepilin-type N-terminal cleavage/methylation domain-containing protein [Thalassolituus sp. ST750PaO-4]|uniref:type IV pilin protein n=1 Tax=Thalassolituus sp. ST750PaO-4 TaxID=2742965 RepID=UPI000C5BC892|nr:type IV pilin protein [Thalassolituus sp. ST750PaO-4]MBU2040271.1 prepilin-type N-terminal cleavage/methylation domain-containing protein [Gammaproteobacteria bacterium]MCA6060297.1 prepilin-type N-terminal cleavage/methylation domain-containing protein [Thalassolituus sp. ST750PaO-4]PIQ39028.1 MAG: hypothetical protein COW58_14060 [Thalassolituus sp. CG17_big_fil_post_rev_8_21_14_2_50_53_8]
MNTLINSKGITILELMVTLAIVAILASAAIPSYQNYSMRGNRSDGIESIHAILSAQERYYADNMTYADSLTKLGMGSTSYTTPKGYYKITVEKCGAMPYTQCVQLVATPPQGNSQEKDGILIFNTTGKQVKKLGSTEVDL